MKRAHCSASVDRFPATGNPSRAHRSSGRDGCTGVEGAALLVEVDGGARGMFSRIAVINRGEPAVRMIRAVRELNAEFGYGIKVVALHTESERGALFVRLADEGVVIREKGELSSPYLDHEVLRKALVESKADAAWVGWGFVAEDPVFAELCAEVGVKFIGPPPE